MAQPVDHARAITASLFASQPGTNAPPLETFIAYVQTFEEQPGTTQRKARFLILSAARDGRLKLHKAKQNGNGTFSIGKTWGMEELRTVEVVKRMVEGFSTPQPLEFILVINGKAYRYETELPSSQQASFLVTAVRCWRRYMAGRGQPDLSLIGFSVDSPQPNQRPTTPSGPPQQSQPQSASSTSALQGQSRSRTPTTDPRAAQQQQQQQGRPGSAASSHRGGPSPLPHAHPHQPPPPPSQPHQRPSNASSTYSLRSSSPPPGGPQHGGQPGAPPSRKPSGPVMPPSSPAGASRPTSVGRRPSVSPIPPAGGPSSSSANTSTAQGISLASGLGIGMGRARSNVGGPPPPSSSGGGESERPPTEREAKRRSTRGEAPPKGSSSSSPAPPTPAPITPSAVVPRKPSVDDLVDDDTVLSNVEEMLEGFEWRGGGGGSGGYGAGGGFEGGAGGPRTGKADEIEKRLVGELKALEAASIHAIMESDDRVTFVIKHLDDALAELDKMDSTIGLYKTQLSLMTDDIAHIEGQNRGLQVQTSNQRMLLSELDNLMSTIHIPEADLSALSQESLENPQGIEKLERAAVSLYKALLSTRDTAVGDMAAASERVGEYRSKASQFCKRVFDFLSIMFKFQIEQILNPKDAAARKLALPSHATMEDFLGRYCGLMLFVKEIDYARYQQICTAYFTAMGDLYRNEVQDLMTTLRGQIKKTSEDELEASFSSAKESPTLRQQSMRRAGTLVRSPLEGGRKEKDGKLTGSEAFGRALSQIAPHIIREQGFVSDFLHINPLDASITFADYMVLETFFRRGATSYLANQQGKLKDIRGAMELIFSFWEAEMRDWIDAVLLRDSMQIVGILAALDRFILQGEEERNEFLMRTLQKQYQKSITALERACKEQIKSIEQTKLTLKKRKGVVPFVRVFPLFVARVEAQLEGADELNIRRVINSNYERIVATMFDCLQQMAKMDGEGQGQGGEAKDQLNYHVILIENMHHIIAVFSSKQKVAALAPFVTQAREKYTQNLDSYIKLVLRRPLSRVLDFFQGLEQLLRTTPPTEVSLHSAYTKSAVRRTLSDVRPKDLRKAIDALYKRVDKHFGDVTNPSAEHTVVLKTVWKATEEELTRLVGVWKSLCDKCYPDDKVGLEFGVEDVASYFKHAAQSY